LTTELGGESVAAGKMKSIGTSFWNSPNTEATNSSGFSGLPGGSRFYDGSFSNIKNVAYFWSATEFNSFNARIRYLDSRYVIVDRYGNGKSVGASVRCLKD
jgi:uncharacterized protein (TIGR02145 family)